VTLFDLPKLKNNVTEIEALMGDDNFWLDQKSAQKRMQELSDYKEKINICEDIKTNIVSLTELLL